MTDLSARDTTVFANEKYAFTEYSMRTTTVEKNCDISRTRQTVPKSVAY